MFATSARAQQTTSALPRLSALFGSALGRVPSAVEYKGEPYKSNDDSREKLQVGHRWEQSSGGRCLFLFAVERDDQGRNVFQQIAHKLA